MNEVEAKEKPAEPETQRIITGEIHIIVDDKTGAVMVNAPANKLIAYGLLELAKEIISKQSAPKAPQPSILRAGADALKTLDRRPS